MLLPDNCDVKQIFRTDFVDMVNVAVNSADNYMFLLYGNTRSQGPSWHNQSIQNWCSARDYLDFINALDKQIERENICIVYGSTCENDCVWIVCSE